VQATAGEPLQVDVPAAKAALTTAIECKVAAQYTDAANERIAAAEAAIAARDAAAGRLKTLLGQKQLSLQLHGAREVVAAGRAAGVDAKLLDKAEAHIQASADAQAKVETDLAALTGAPPLEMEVAKARACLEAARAVAGITPEVVSAAEARIEAAEAAAGTRDAAAARVKALLPLAPLKLKLEDAQRQVLDGKAAGVDAELITKAEAHIQASADAQAKVAKDLAALTGAPPLEMEVAKARACLEAARAVASITPEMISAAEARIEAAEAAAGARDAARDAATGRLKALLGQKQLSLQLGGAREAVAAGKAAGVDTKLLDKAKAHIQASADAQTKVETDLAALTGAPPLEMEVAKARACLEAARAVASITPEVISATEARIEAAEAAAGGARRRRPRSRRFFSRCR